ncbi:hypothetical protein B9Z55_018174 [Caenorhabditis nigoni]|uniref:Serpentine receptor class r-10 n=3 Tax=Caenorhabditis nigoni TaxID=1611254 RepID=A0A2G5TD28_9PELO|nr:hypothetical protein B9Z55_018174 [Caenorhabditis nigoni]
MWIQDIAACVSLVINSFLIFMILTKSPPQLGAYKYLMIYISVFEMFCSILDLIMVPQHFSHGPTFLVIVETKDKLLSPTVLSILNALYWGCFGASMAVFAVHFVYRWLVVSENRLLQTFNGWKICLWFSIPVWYGVTWVCTGYILCGPNENTSRFIKDNIKEVLGLEFNEYTYLGPFLYDKDENGTDVVYVAPFIGLGIISGTICSSIVIVLTFGILCYIRIKNIVVTTVNSLKMRSLQRQLFFALVIQTLVPFLLMHIPVALMFAFVFLDIDLGVYSAIVSMTIAIYPAVDPIPTLVIVENYRKTIIYWICCCKKAAHVPGQTTIEPTRFTTLPPSGLELDLDN